MIEKLVQVEHNTEMNFQMKNKINNKKLPSSITENLITFPIIPTIVYPIKEEAN